MEALEGALDAFDAYTPELAERIRRDESRCDRYEDALGTYLVRLSAHQLGKDESEEATELLKPLGDLERSSDHAGNVLESAEELRSKGLTFSPQAARELTVLTAAIREILGLARRALAEKDQTPAAQVAPQEPALPQLQQPSSPLGSECPACYNRGRQRQGGIVWRRK